MSRHVDVYYSLGSPWTYLGWQRLLDLLAATGSSAGFRPVRMSTVFAATGGLPLPRRSPQRQAYRLQELERWRSRLGVPLNLEPRFFPVDDAAAARLVIAHREAGGDAGRLSLALLRAVWVEERDIASAETLAAIEAELGLDGKGLLKESRSPEIEARYAADTEEAVRRGVFGAPTFIVGATLLWGQDRLDFLAETLGAGPGR
jgi:carboxymethylenebutenolidase